MNEEIQKYVNEYIDKGWSACPIYDITSEIKKDSSGNIEIDDEGNGKIKKIPYMADWKIFQTNPLTKESAKKWFHISKGIAVLTGKISGITVLDIDVKNFPELDKLPATYTVASRKGCHKYYQYTDKVTQSQSKAKDIDIRNGGGVIFAPPTKYFLPDGTQTGYTVIDNSQLAPFPVEWYFDYLKRNPCIKGDKGADTGEKTNDWNSILNSNLKDGEGRNKTGASIIGKLFSVLDPKQWDTVAKPLYFAWAEEHYADKYSQKEKETLYQNIKATVTQRINSGKDLGTPCIDSNGDIITATVPYKEGIIQFEFSEFEFTNKSCEVIIKCSLDTKIEGLGSVFYQKINLLNGKAIDDAVNRLNRAFGSNINWTQVMFSIVPDIMRIYERNNAPEDFNPDYDDTEIIPLVRPFLEYKDSNILFGDGSGGKTFIALSLGMAVCWNIPFLGTHASELSNVLFVDYENKKRKFDDRLKRLLNGRTTDTEFSFKYYNPKGMPILNLKSSLSEYIREHKIGLVIIDSIGGACGGDPSKADIANATVNILNNLGCTVLAIAHQTKAGECDKPFGSVFWHNGPRCTWNVKKEQEADEDIIRVGMFNRKNNNDKLSRPFGAEIVFNGKESIIITKSDTKLWFEELSGKDKILSVLESGILTLDEVVKETGMKPQTVKNKLGELTRKGLVENPMRGQYKKVIKDDLIQH